jgi:dolichyl-phosphate beta-glucosyltransferase
MRRVRSLTFSYILPVHNEEQTLDATVARILERAERSPIARIIGVENGSRDASWAKLQEVAARQPRVTALQEPQAGLGYALHRGTQAACAIDSTADHYLVYTACDLPFGFTDLDQFERLAGKPEVAIGSKAHPDSDIHYDRKRLLMSKVYRLARRALVGMRTRDSQGTFHLRSDVASWLWPQVVARDFFYTTEVCYLLERSGRFPVELPITFEGEQRASSVNAIRHSTAMLKQLWKLRGRQVA